MLDLSVLLWVVISLLGCLLLSTGVGLVVGAVIRHADKQAARVAPSGHHPVVPSPRLAPGVARD